MQNARIWLISCALLLGFGVASYALGRRSARDPSDADGSQNGRCREGFVVRGTRCCPFAPAGSKTAGNAADGACPNTNRCPFPLRASPDESQCEAFDKRIRLEAQTFDLDSADWETEGKVKKHVEVKRPFELDAFELTELAAAKALGRNVPAQDGTRAAILTLDEARAACSARGGRLPTDGEWLIAAGARNHRYPWGPTGAVCRRAAWGLLRGPCGSGATGPDTVGAHEEGSNQGFFDLAGNVSEWTTAENGKAQLRGGSYASEFAAELRSWSVSVSDTSSVAKTTGARCAYDLR
jgi:formylglycine-generating enzyme